MDQVTWPFFNWMVETLMTSVTRSLFLLRDIQGIFRYIYIFSMTSLVGSSSNRKEPRIDHPKRPIWESTLCEGPNDLWLEDCSSTPRGLKKRAEYNLLVQPWQGKLRSNANSSFTSVGHHWYPPKAPATNPIKSWCHRSTNHLQDWVNQVKSEVLTYCVAGIYGL